MKLEIIFVTVDCHESIEQLKDKKTKEYIVFNVQNQK